MGTWGGSRSGGGRDGGKAAQAPPEPSGELVVAMERPGFGGKDDGELRLTVEAYNGNKFLSLRLWESRPGAGQFFPSRKGVSVRLNEAATVAAAILEALDKAGGPPEPGGRATASPRPRPSAPPARQRPAPHSDRDRAPWDETVAAMEPARPGFDEFDGGSR